MAPKRGHGLSGGGFELSGLRFGISLRGSRSLRVIGALRLMVKILHYLRTLKYGNYGIFALPKDPKVWELRYIPNYG